jgi:ankyrin repeat protein
MGDGRTPLHYAVVVHSLPIVRLLADITAPDAEGLTPLTMALNWLEAITVSDTIPLQ